MSKEEKKSVVPIKTEKDFKYVQSKEKNSFFISFLGDAPLIEESIIFTKKEVEKHYEMLLNHCIDMYNDSSSPEEQEEAANAAFNLRIWPLRLH